MTMTDTPAAPTPRWDAPRCMQPVGPCRLTLGHSGPHEARSTPAEALDRQAESLRMVPANTDYATGYNDALDDILEGVNRPPSAPGGPLDVERLKTAWRKHRVVANLRGYHLDCDEECATDIIARLSRNEESGSFYGDQQDDPHQPDGEADHA